MDKGFDALTIKQKYVFNKEVIKINSVNECERCAIAIPWCEMLAATDNGGFCSYCAHMKEKIMNE